MKFYILDGRAHHDIDSASIIDAFTAKTYREARDYLNDNYEDQDVVLVDSDMSPVY